MKDFFCKFRGPQHFSHCERQCVDCRIVQYGEKKYTKREVFFIRCAALVVLIVILSLLVSCSPETRVRRILDRNPSMLVTDTVYRDVLTVSPGVSVDTVFSRSTDTVKLYRDRLKVEYFRDTVNKTVYLSGECAPDTVRIKTPVQIKAIRDPAPGPDMLMKVLIGCLLVIAASFLLKGVSSFFGGK